MLTGLFRLLLAPLIVFIIVILIMLIGLIGFLQGFFELINRKPSKKLMSTGRLLMNSVEVMIMYLIGMIVIIE